MLFSRFTLVLGFTCVLSTASLAKAQAGERKVDVFYTGDVHGTLEPCGCTSDPLGDIARLTRVIREARKQQKDVLFLDAGNLSFPRETPSPRKAAETKLTADFIQKEWERLEPVGCGLGSADRWDGTIGIRPQRVATNVEPDPRVVPFKRVKSGGIEVGVVGYVDPVVAKAAGLVPVEAERALKATAEQLRSGGVEIIFLLAPTDRPTARRVARSAGVDFIVLGKDVGEGLVRAEQVGEAFMIAPGEEATRLGRLTLVLRGPALKRQELKDAGTPALAKERLSELGQRIDKLQATIESWRKDPATDAAFLASKVKALDDLKREQSDLEHNPFQVPNEGSYFQNRLIPIHRQLPRDPALAHSMRVLDKAIGKAALAVAEPPPPADKGQASYVGDAKCVSCHKSAARQSATTRHAQAWKTLVKVGKTGQEDCVACHVTGFGEQGGSSFGFTKGLQNIQCEACHGPGSIHVEKRGKETPFAGRLKTPESICVRCHNEKHSDTFQYEAYLRDVIGPGHGEDARDALGDGPTGKALRKAAKSRAAAAMTKH